MRESELYIQLKNWDGRHIDYLISVYKKEQSNENFFEELVTFFSQHKELQKAVTWLIKHHYDEGQRLPQNQTEKIIFSLDNLDHWEAQLHILQLLAFFSLTDITIPLADNFVRKQLKSKNKFVKAWAYYGLYVISTYIPEMKTELEFLCQRAMQTESAAVKSRIKKILNKLDS